MYLTLDQWNLGYSQILKDCRSSSSGNGCILILCAMDADAMCTARIVTYCLRGDGILYQLRPCGSYEALTKALGCISSSNPQEEDTTDDIRAVLLINLGSMKNLTSLIATSSIFSPSSENDTKLYVLDCHRPIHLANIYAGRQVVVFVDELAEEELPGDGDGLSGDEEEDEDEQDEDSIDDNQEEEQEQEFMDDDEDQRTAIDKDDVSIIADSEKDDASESSNADVPVEAEEDDETMAQQETTRDTLEELLEKRRKAIALYYSAGAFWGAPSSWVAYTIATKGLRFGNVADLLWMACVGVTDAYIHRRLDMGGYAVFSQDLSEHVQRLYPNDNLIGRAMNAFSSANDNTIVSASEAGRILRQQEYKFILLRHWTLYDSMFYSTHVATKLQVYMPDGKQQLRELLAKMGFPLDECQQPFAFMRPALKLRLKDAIEAHAENYGLEDAAYTGFVRVSGYKSLISASDMSYAVTALLECNTQLVQGASEQQLVDSFNIAYDALNPKSSPLYKSEGFDLSTLVNGGDLSGAAGLGAGIRLAISLQKLIFSTALNLVDKNAIVRLSHFRYAYLTTSTANKNGKDAVEAKTQHHIFSRPLALCKLATFLMDMHRENEKWVGNKARPPLSSLPN